MLNRKLTQTHRCSYTFRQWEIHGKPNNITENLEQMKTPLEPRKVKQQTKTLESQPTKLNSFKSDTRAKRRSIKEGNIIINRDWVKSM